MTQKRHIFRAYDIRGVVNEDFSAPWVERLGRALGTYFLGQGYSNAVIGRDCRLSSPEYAAVLRHGLCASGVDVVDVGMVPTPALYFAVKHLQRQAGVMITASHNPPEYNGFKIWAGESTLYGSAIQEVADIFDAGAFIQKQRERGLSCEHNILPAYEDAICERVSLARSLRVVVDGGNGAGGLVLASVLRRLGATVIELFCEPDGTFPNHHPDPTVEKNMRACMEAVQAQGADIGMGLDGDADRLGVVDPQGRLLNGDEVLAIFARDLVERVPDALILADVKCSDRFFDDVRARGGRAEMCMTGHSLVKARMKALNAHLAGELSGHMFFDEGWFGFDDAIYGAARLLGILSRMDTPLSELPGWPVAWTTREIHVACPEEKKWTVIRAAQDYYGARYPVSTLDGVRVRFAHGWGLARASNTQPVLVLRAEADSEAHLHEIREELEERIAAWVQRKNT